MANILFINKTKETIAASVSIVLKRGVRERNIDKEREKERDRKTHKQR